MKSADTIDGAALSHPSVELHAGSAELAAKVAALPHGTLRHGRLWWICHSMLWFVAIGLLAAALLRLIYHDGNHLLTWINAFTRYVYLPAYACLVWALWNRRWLLTLVALTVVAFHVSWNLPDFVRHGASGMSTATSAPAANEPPTVRIFFANVLATNHDLGPLWKEIEAAEPHVVVLAECSRFSDRSIRQTPAMADYVHTNGRRRSQIGEVKIYSKLPIKSESQHWFGSRVVQKVDVEVGNQTLRVIGIHAPRPQLPGYGYFRFWETMVPILTAESGPVAIVGDFNATQHSLVYKQLKNGGLRSAHDDRGRGYATTWPNGTWPVPPIRIDQAFVSPEVECVNITEGRGKGSDHKPLVVDVTVRGAQTAGSVASRVE